MKDSVSKPESILRYEFINDILSLINDSRLPPYVMEAALKDILEKVTDLTNRQLSLDMASYNAAITENRKEE